MKIYFVILISILLSCHLSMSLEAGCDKETECHSCQKTVYNLKFNYRTDCNSAARCKSTCFKVMEMWNQPGSIFNAFINDSVGKCDSCFRAGFCSQSQCTDQKRLEQKIVEQTVDRSELTATVNTSEMDVMVGKIIKNEKVNFSKFRKDIKGQVHKALKAEKFLKNKAKIGKVFTGVLSANNTSIHQEGIEEGENKKNSREHKLHHQTQHRKIGPVSCKSSDKHLERAEKHAAFKVAKTHAKFQKIKRTLKRTKKYQQKVVIHKKMKKALKKMQAQKRVVRHIKAIAKAKKNPVHPHKNPVLANKLHDVVKHETAKIKKLVKVLKRKDISADVKNIVIKSLKAKVRVIKKVDKIRRDVKAKQDPKVQAKKVKKIVKAAKRQVKKDVKKLKSLVKILRKTTNPHQRAVIRRVIKSTVKSAKRVQTVVKKIQIANPCLSVHLKAPVHHKAAHKRAHTSHASNNCQTPTRALKKTIAAKKAVVHHNLKRINKLKAVLHKVKSPKSKAKIVKTIQAVKKNIHKAIKTVKNAKKIIQAKKAQHKGGLPAKQNKVVKKLAKITKKAAVSVKHLLTKLKNRKLPAKAKAAVIKDLKKKIKTMKIIKKLQKKAKAAVKVPKKHQSIVHKTIVAAKKTVKRDVKKIKKLVNLMHKVKSGRSKAIIKRIIKNTVKSAQKVNKVIKHLVKVNPCIKANAHHAHKIAQHLISLRKHHQNHHAKKIAHKSARHHAISHSSPKTRALASNVRKLKALVKTLKTTEEHSKKVALLGHIRSVVRTIRGEQKKISHPHHDVKSHGLPKEFLNRLGKVDGAVKKTIKHDVNHLKNLKQVLKNSQDQHSKQAIKRSMRKVYKDLAKSKNVEKKLNDVIITSENDIKNDYVPSVCDVKMRHAIKAHKAKLNKAHAQVINKVLAPRVHHGTKVSCKTSLKTAKKAVKVADRKVKETAHKISKINSLLHKQKSGGARKALVKVLAKQVKTLKAQRHTALKIKGIVKAKKAGGAKKAVKKQAQLLKKENAEVKALSKGLKTIKNPEMVKVVSKVLKAKSLAIRKINAAVKKNVKTGPKKEAQKSVAKAIIANKAALKKTKGALLKLAHTAVTAKNRKDRDQAVKLIHVTKKAFTRVNSRLTKLKLANPCVNTATGKKAKMNHLKHKIVQAKHLFKALKNAKTKFAKAGVIKKLRKVVQKIHDAKNKIIAKANHTPKTKTHLKKALKHDIVKTKKLVAKLHKTKSIQDKKVIAKVLRKTLKNIEKAKKDMKHAPAHAPAVHHHAESVHHHVKNIPEIHNNEDQKQKLVHALYIPTKVSSKVRAAINQIKQLLLDNEKAKIAPNKKQNMVHKVDALEHFADGAMHTVKNMRGFVKNLKHKLENNSKSEETEDEALAKSEHELSQLLNKFDDGIFEMDVAKSTLETFSKRLKAI